MRNDRDPPIDWKTGFEIELLAPAGKNRRDLARAISADWRAQVQSILYPQSEPSKAPGVQVFENLVLGFKVQRDDGSLIALCVDDLTIQSDLNFHAPSKKGWYRIISDDARLLELVLTHCDPQQSQRNVLQPLAKLFDSKLQNEKGLFKVVDRLQRSVAIAATLPGERERVCELITAPISENHTDQLVQLLDCAKSLDFSIPREAAVHVHFDAKKLASARVFCRMVEVFNRHGKSLKQMVKSNPHCLRLGDIPLKLVRQCQEPGFAKIGWKPASKILKNLELSKYVDFNFLNMVHEMPGKNTFEVRIFPGTIDACAIATQTEIFAGILHWCCKVNPDHPTPASLDKLLQEAKVKPC